MTAAMPADTNKTTGEAFRAMSGGSKRRREGEIMRGHARLTLHIATKEILPRKSEQSGTNDIESESGS